MARSKGSVKKCGLKESKKRLVDAKEFLEAAEILESCDVVATNAIHGAIAAADAITCFSLGERSKDGNHQAAILLLNKVDSKLGSLLKRALDLKTKAGYESVDISASDAQACVRRASSLVEAAEKLIR